MKIAVLLLIALPASAFQATIPKKYDPASLQSVQAQFGALNAKLDAAVATFRSVGQVAQKVNTLSLGLRALQVQVAGLDVTQNSDRLTRLEDWSKANDADRAARLKEADAHYEALVGFLKWICGSIGVLLVGLLDARLRKNRRDTAVDGALRDVKSDTAATRTQTNGMNERLQAENEALRSRLKERP